jgi:hypothetical protein
VSYALIGVSPPPPQPLKEFPALARVTVNEGDLGRDKPKGLKVKLRGSEGKKAPRPTDSKIDGFEDHWTIGHRLAISIVQGTGEYPEGDEGGGGGGRPLECRSLVTVHTSTIHFFAYRQLQPAIGLSPMVPATLTGPLDPRTKFKKGDDEGMARGRAPPERASNPSRRNAESTQSLLKFQRPLTRLFNRSM